LADSAAAKASADKAKTAYDYALNNARESVAQFTEKNQERIDVLKK